MDEVQVAEEQLVLRELCPEPRALRHLRRLADNDLKGFVAPKIDLLRVSIEARVGELSIEFERNSQPFFISRRTHLGQPAGKIDRTVNPLIRPDINALTQMIISPRRRRQINREVCHGCVALRK